MQLARIELCQTDALILLHLSKEESSEQLDSIGALLVDIVARVSAYQALQLSRGLRPHIEIWQRTYSGHCGTFGPLQ